MCETASMVLTENSELWSADHDSHERLLSGVRQDLAGRPCVVRLEFTPTAMLDDLDSWQMTVDQYSIPAWWEDDPASHEARARAALGRWFKAKFTRTENGWFARGDMHAARWPDGALQEIVEVGGCFDAPALASAPVLVRVGGEFQAPALTSAPALEEVGWYFEALALMSAPVLTRVGGGFNAPALTSAPALEEVGWYFEALSLTSAPALKVVEGGFDAPALTSAPALEGVGGRLDAPELADAPKLRR